MSIAMTDIYQTLEDRGNDQDIEKHGPYFCSLYDETGNLKKGTKVPWLGEGFYFWDTRIDDANWWGRMIYESQMKGYVVCHTSYNQHSPLLYDMVGDVSMFNDFVDCAKQIKSKKRLEKVRFPVVLKYLKNRKDFKYKAIRVWPDPKQYQKGMSISNPQIEVFFPGDKATIKRMEKIQICFFDKTMLTRPYEIVERHPMSSDFTI